MNATSSYWVILTSVDEQPGGGDGKRLTMEISWAQSQSAGVAMTCLARQTSQIIGERLRELGEQGGPAAAAGPTGERLRGLGGNCSGLQVADRRASEGLLDLIVERGTRPPRRSSMASSRAIPGVGVHGESQVGHLVEKSIVTLVRVLMGPPGVSQCISWSMSVL